MLASTPEIITAKELRFQCRHIHAAGHRCGAIALRNEEFCYFHHSSRRPVQNLTERRSRQAAFTLPTPEDRGSIQLCIGEIIQRVATNQIDRRRAALILYGLQIAAGNLPRTPPPSTRTIEDITVDPDLGALALPREYGPPEHEKTLQEILEEQWANTP